MGEILDERKVNSEDSEEIAQALLMYILGPQISLQLLTAVACGVGLASAFGLLRLQYRFGLKVFIFSSVIPLLVITFFCWRSAKLACLVGVSWDSGAITTGPATVPIVLSMGIGVAKTARRSREPRRIGGCCSVSEQSDLDGFGIVTLASLLPVFTVLAFGIFCSFFIDLDAQMSLHSAEVAASSALTADPRIQHGYFNDFPLKQLWESCRAMAPLTTFLIVIQAMLIREPPAGTSPRDLGKGIVATLAGLFIFNIGLCYGSVPLGEEAGQVLPTALSGSRFLQWASADQVVWLGRLSVMLFGFVAGFMATVIDLEPCGLGETVERLSGGEFTKRDLIISVASGVGIGIVLGFAKVLYELDLLLVLVIGYTIALALTLFVDEGLCCIAWDSAGVTTGPVTVPLVLSMGVGICGKVGSVDGFGILACASVSPIISVLIAAILRTKVCRHRR